MKNYILAAVIFFSSQLFAESYSIKLAWDPNPESNLAGYNVYYRRELSTEYEKLDAGKNTLIEIRDLAKGQKYFVHVTAYNISGLESDPSDEIEFLMPKGTDSLTDKHQITNIFHDKNKNMTIIEVQAASVFGSSGGSSEVCHISQSVDLKQWNLISILNLTPSQNIKILVGGPKRSDAYPEQKSMGFYKIEKIQSIKD